MLSTRIRHMTKIIFDLFLVFFLSGRDNLSSPGRLLARLINLVGISLVLGILSREQEKNFRFLISLNNVGVG